MRQEAIKLDRNARRRSETRTKLLAAAQSVIATVGVQGTTIQAITEAADVGFGTFYNHFESKEAVYDAVIARTIKPWTDALDAVGSEISDPAQLLATSIRLTLRHAQHDPNWGAFVSQTGQWLLQTQTRLDGHLARTIHRGIAADRFKVNNAEVAVNAVGGAVLSNLQALLRGDIGEAECADIAVVCLQLLGVRAEEAQTISKRALPRLDPRTSA